MARRELKTKRASYAVGLDTLGTDNPIVIDGDPVVGDYLEVSWEDYSAAINCLVNGQHVCVADGVLILGYQIPQGTVHDRSLSRIPAAEPHSCVCPLCPVARSWPKAKVLIFHSRLSSLLQSPCSQYRGSWIKVRAIGVPS